VHMDVKKLDRIPDKGRWRARSRAGTQVAKSERSRIEYDYAHPLVNDHTAG